MQRSQRAVLAVAIFILISIVIFLAFKDIIMRAIFMLVAFVALLRVLWEIATLKDKEQSRVEAKVRMMKGPLTVEYGMNGQVRGISEGGPAPTPTKRKALGVRIVDKGERAKRL